VPDREDLSIAARSLSSARICSTNLIALHTRQVITINCSSISGRLAGCNPIVGTHSFGNVRCSAGVSCQQGAIRAARSAVGKSAALCRAHVTARKSNNARHHVRPRSARLCGPVSCLPDCARATFVSWHCGTRSCRVRSRRRPANVTECLSRRARHGGCDPGRRRIPGQRISLGPKPETTAGNFRSHIS